MTNSERRELPRVSQQAAAAAVAEAPRRMALRTVRNVTEQKRLQAELSTYRTGLDRIIAERTAALSATNAKLEAANKELEAFSYSVSHDLRTPLRAIDGFSRILLESYADKLDAEGLRLLNVVRDSTLKMSRLIDDILAFSRIGRVEMQAAPVDMEPLVRGLLATELAPAIIGRTVAVDIGKLPPAHGDRAMLERVWRNLLDNAVKFSAGKADARITVGANPGNGETVYFVSDNGVGFDMQYAGKLFGVFQRLHGAEFPGTGIGLAIVKRIVVRHGGRVWADGKIGEGATVSFALPTKGSGR
jgi:light-regulated signal transduction histidine kinase (bacteriophytochrome)